MKVEVIGIVLLLLFAACRDKSHPNIAHLLTERKIIRFDRELWALDHEHPDINTLSSGSKEYLKRYASGVIQLGRADAPHFEEYLSLFLQDSTIHEIYDTVAMKYADMREQEQELSKAFAYYAYYFPGRIIPQVYTHISGFNQSVVVDSAFVGVSLDNYLGERCIFYDMLVTPIPMYARKKMTERDIVRDVLLAWVGTEYPFHPKTNDLVSGMIYQGKIIYLLEKLFPDYTKERLFGFTKEQLLWCEKNENQIWNFLVENEYLFSTRQVLIMKYISDAPFTSGMPAESPGRTVVWTGYQIIKSYVEKSGIALEELLWEQDYHKILRGAKYRP